MPRAYIETILSSEAGKPRLALTDDLGFVAAVAIARRLQRQLPEVAFERLGGRAVARISAVVAEVLGHLGLHGAFEQRLGQLFQQSVFANDVFRLLVIQQQLVDKFNVDCHRVSLV
jgi:hypothetical protein